MEKAIREIREEIQDIHDTLEDGEEGKELKKATESLLRILSRPELDKQANARADLARAIMEFAEWQSTGYIDDSNTRKIISQSLWDRVSDNVRDVLQCTPPIPTFS